MIMKLVNVLITIFLTLDKSGSCAVCARRGFYDVLLGFKFSLNTRRFQFKFCSRIRT